MSNFTLPKQQPAPKPDDSPKNPDHTLLYQTDGKDRRHKTKEEQIKEVEALSELLDLKSTNYFGTYDKEVFAKKLETMTISDKRDLGMKVGTMFYERERELDKALLGAFDDYLRSYRSNLTGPSQQSIPKDSPEYEKIKDLL